MPARPRTLATAVSAIALVASGLSGSASAATGVHLIGHLSQVGTGSGVHRVAQTRTVLTGITGLAPPSRPG